MYGYDYEIELRNVGAETRYGVFVESSKGLKFSFGTTVSDSQASYGGKKPFPFRDVFTVYWSNAEKDMFNDYRDKPFKGEIDTTAIPKDFRGVVQIYIDGQNQLYFKAIPFSEKKTY
jgi:hypothetical protein